MRSSMRGVQGRTWGFGSSWSRDTSHFSAWVHPLQSTPCYHMSGSCFQLVYRGLGLGLHSLSRCKGGHASIYWSSWILTPGTFVCAELPSLFPISPTSDSSYNDDNWGYISVISAIWLLLADNWFAVILILRTYAFYMEDRRVLAFLVTLYVTLAGGAIVSFLVIVYELC